MAKYSYCELRSKNNCELLDIIRDKTSTNLTILRVSKVLEDRLGVEYTGDIIFKILAPVLV